MEQSNPPGRSYWDLLTAATDALEAGDLPKAEGDYHLACDQRQDSPGRIFFSETITDKLSELVRGKAQAKAHGGRWNRSTGQFRQEFMAAGEKIVRKAVRLAELRPEDDAQNNQPILETALFLVGRSRLFAEEPSSAVPLLKGIFRTAGKTGLPFDAQLIRHDIPLSEEDRLWLARKGPEMLEEFVAAGSLKPGTVETEAWVRIILQLLNPRYFSSVGRLAEERAWLEAVTADHLLGQSQASVELYKAYLQVNFEPGPRPDEARIRLLEIQANVDQVHCSVPDYDQALGAMQSAGLAPGSSAADRFQHALEKIEFRRPDPEPGSQGTAWASVGLEPDGRVAAVFWWKNEPRDVAFWTVGDDPAPMIRFLEPCGGRLVAADPSVQETVASQWEESPAPWSIQDFALALLEPFLPEAGLSEEILLKLGLGQSGPWRDGWKTDLGHPYLNPPRRSALLETWQGGTASGALLGGLVWRTILGRINRSDPALRAGMGAMARKGDPAAGFVYEFLCLDEGQTQSLDSSFEPWTLPLLWTRPDPFGWGGGSQSPLTSSPGAEAEATARPDLGHNDLAIVSSGDPASVLAAWGERQQKWRVVLDRLDRVAELSRVAVSAIGPVTLIPASGKVFSLEGCLDLLNNLLTREGRPAGRQEGLLPLFHWTRLVECHNGDLLDFLLVRPRASADISFFERYQELIATIDLIDPVLDADGARSDGDPWAVQFSQRVRKAGLVAGLAHSLVLDEMKLDSLWGVFDGSDASWVFLDSAAVHWHLMARMDVGIHELHQLLQTRGARHLSLLTGGIWMRSELEDLLGTWLAAYGRPYCLALTNLQPPVLHLVDRGIAPDAVQLVVEAHAAPVAHVRAEMMGSGRGAVLLPAKGSHRRLWQGIASQELDLGQENWAYLDPHQVSDFALPAQCDVHGANRLMVPVLDSLADETMPIAQEDTVESWQQADRDRRQYLLWRRRLCSLEIAGLMAGPWQGVEIMDVRWWRILESEASDAPSGDKALAVAAPTGARLFHLPGLGRHSATAIHPNTLESVRQWLSQQGAMIADRPPAGPLSAGEEKVYLAIQDSGEVWQDLALPLACGWEEGQLASWLLLVSPQVPTSAAAQVAAGYSPGLSVWTGQNTYSRPGAILWCLPENLDDPDLQTYLESHPPALALALGVQDWLPGGARTGQLGAGALRTILNSSAGKMVLQADYMPAAWLEFLKRELAAQVVVGPSQVEAESDQEALLGEENSAPESVMADAPLAHSTGELVERMQFLLGNIRPALGLAGTPGGTEATSQISRTNQLVPVSRLGALAGLSEPDISTSFRLLRWVARLAGDSLSDAEAASLVEIETADGHTVLIQRRFAELEHQLQTLQEHLSVMLPLILEGRRPGQVTWFDLEFPPLQIASHELHLVDTYLLACCHGQTKPMGLTYQCPRGILNSTQRLVGTTQPVPQVLQAVQNNIQLFTQRLEEVMGAAVETGDGFLVETGLRELRPDELNFLSLGSSLMFWTWTGPTCPGALHLVDLLTTADSPSVKAGCASWDLLAAALDRPAREFPEPSVPKARGSVTPENSLWSRDRLRSILPGSGKTDEVADLAARVTTLVSPANNPGLMVVSGLMGSGRNQAVARGLTRAAMTGATPEIVVFCPDSASAAHFQQQLMWEGFPSPSPTFRLVADGEGLTRSQPWEAAGDPGSRAVVVMLEIHRFDAETRYQIAQYGRGRRQILTTDPAASTEPWEHLFLTVPRQDEVVHLHSQKVISRKVWDEVARLVADKPKEKKGFAGPAKGQIEAVYAVNLDQCLTRVVQDVETKALPSRLRLVGPLAADLDFLAGALRERGWLVVREENLDPLQLPGSREFLAAAAMAVNAMGHLARYFPSPENEPASSEATPKGNTFPDPQKILNRFLGPESQAALVGWAEDISGFDHGMTVGQFWKDLETRDWFLPVLADQDAYGRTQSLVKGWPDLLLVDMPAQPLWEAWWWSALSDVDLDYSQPRRPLVTLAPSHQPSGSTLEGGVYICLGTEMPRQHYAVLSRMSDQVLILYKERSPLVSDSGPV